MYNCFDIAKKIIEFAKDENMSMSPMKLLKLTYIAHGYYLGFTDEPLFENEVQAWKFGPVIPDLYHIIKRYGQSAVDYDCVDLYSESELNKEDTKFLKAVWDAYKKFDGLQLSSKTHKEGTPWYEVYDGKHFNIIDNYIIKNYYKKLIDERRAATAEQG